MHLMHIDAFPLNNQQLSINAKLSTCNCEMPIRDIFCVPPLPGAGTNPAFAARESACAVRDPARPRATPRQLLP
jgi:hypothetical protein